MTQIAAATARPIGWYHGWNIVAVCILSQVAANGLTYNTFSLFLRDWSAALHSPVSQLQLAVAAMAVVAALISPMVGAWADKYPARRLFACGLIGMAIFYVAIGWVRATWQLLALYGLLAPLSLALSTAVVANALISRWFVRRLGLALGLSAFGIGMAGVVLPPIIAALLPTVGWRMIWRGGGLLIALVVMPLVVFVIRNRPTEREGLYYLSGDDKPLSHPHAPTHPHAAGASQLSWRAVIARKNFWLLVAIYLPIMGLYGGCAQNLAPYAASHSLSLQTAGWLLLLLSLAHVVSTLVLGLLSDRFGNRLPFAGLALVLVLGAMLLAFGTGLPAIAVGCAFVGAGGGVFTLLAAAVAVEFGAEGVGRAFGLCMLFLPVMSLAPFAVAKTQEITGSYVPALMGLTVLVIIAGALSLMLRERRGGQATLRVPESQLA
jgi:MFS family permease